MMNHGPTQWRCRFRIACCCFLFVCVFAIHTTESFSMSRRFDIRLFSALHAVRDLLDEESLDDQARDMAVDALGSVLSDAVPAEKALQRILRRLSRNLDYSDDDQRYLRARFSLLILGVSIWKRRYEYILSGASDSASAFRGGLANGTNVSNGHDKRMIQRMVDLHFASLDDSNYPNDDDAIIWPSGPAERLSVQCSLPLFLCQALVQQYGVASAQELCQVMNYPGPVNLRRNAVRCTSDDLLVERLSRNHNITATRLDSVLLATTSTCSWTPPPGCFRLSRLSSQPSMWSMSAWQEGWFEVQDVGSQLIVQATEARLGETIVDYCAGNGGKTLALASLLMESRIDNHTQRASTIWAHDVVPERLRQLQGSLPRAGLGAHDSICIRTTTNATRDLANSMADIVLVDAPCSSSGVLRRRPSQRWIMSEHEAQCELPKLQLDILTQASRLVKPGGRLVYATCSLLAWENEQVVEAWKRQWEATGSHGSLKPRHGL